MGTEEEAECGTVEVFLYCKLFYGFWRKWRYFHWWMEWGNIKNSYCDYKGNQLGQREDFGDLFFNFWNIFIAKVMQWCHRGNKHRITILVFSDCGRTSALPPMLTPLIKDPCGITVLDYSGSQRGHVMWGHCAVSACLKFKIYFVNNSNMWMKVESGSLSWTLLLHRSMQKPSDGTQGSVAS